MNVDKEILACEVTVIISLPARMFQDFLVIIEPFRGQAPPFMQGTVTKVRILSAVSMWLSSKVANLDKDSAVRGLDWRRQLLCR